MTDTELLKLNPFELVATDRMIACVGDNGGTYNESILNGFKDSALILIQSIQNGKNNEDELIYPIVFSIRHSIELALKIILASILHIYVRKKVSIPLEEKDFHTHDIEILSKHIRKIVVIDRRLNPLFDIALKYTCDYYFDKKSDMFRYEKDLDGNDSLKAVGIGHISIDTLAEKYKRMMGLLTKGIIELEKIKSEYDVGTFTKDLSRADLEEISKRLLPLNEWSKDAFDECKNDIKKDYKIGSNKLSDAINIIKSHPLFASNIGKEIPLGHINEAELKAYGNLVKHELAASIPDDSCRLNEGIEKLLAELPVKTARMLETAKEISDEALYSIAAFGDMCRCGDRYCERYQKHYDHFAGDSNIERLWLLEKVSQTNYWKEVLQGMQWCGQLSFSHTLAESIEG